MMKPFLTSLAEIAILVLLVTVGANRTLTVAADVDTDEIPSITLKDIRSLLAKCPEAKTEFRGRWLFLSGLATVDVETAKSLSAFKADALSLTGLTSLDAETAAALAGFTGNGLLLNGAAQLQPDTAKALATVKGEWLASRGLTSLDADTTKALVQFQGNHLEIWGLMKLHAETAEALAGSTKWDGDLSSVVTIDSPDSVKVAAALATRKGPLNLPHLKKLSPKTLAALIAKEDVEVPLIETLELIQEPDGSVTDDFIIPDGLGKRQKRQRQ